MTAVSPEKRNQRNIRIRADYLFVAPALVVVVLFLLGPLIIITLTSFYTPTGSGYVEQLTSQNYGQIFSSSSTLSTFVFTLGSAGIVTISSLILAYPVAYFLSLKITSFRLRTVMLVALIIPFWVDFTTRALSWIPWLSVAGIVNIVLVGLHIFSQPSTLFLYTPFSMILVMIQGYVVFMIGPLFIAMSRIDPILYEAAQTSGASPLRVFYHVNLKLSLPGIGVGTVFVFLSSIADFATPRLIGGLVTSIGQLIQDNVTFQDLPVASALSVIITAIALAIVILDFRFAKIRQIFE
jgi:putative spermidine/putrescine transport system permease protein